MESGGRDLSRSTVEDSARRNTDCVYFLASPLTCKKGSECEYRHSEGARVNPMDCWFWLNGNCLNLKCSFRHPPLDGFLGEPGTSPGSSQLSTQIARPSLGTHAPTISSKQSTPCYYYQNGGCLKGEKCPFMHDAQLSSNPGVQQTTKPDIPVTEPFSAPKSASLVVRNFSQHHEVSADKMVKFSQISKKAAVKTEKMLTGGLSVKSSHMPSRLSNVISHTLPQASFACNASGVSERHEGRHLEPLAKHNGREADESLREPSPGFDVLVDDECEDTDYFQMDRRDTSIHEVDEVDGVNDFDYHHSSGYNSLSQIERESHRIHNEVNDYDHHGPHERYDQDDHRHSERIMARISVHGKMTSHKDDHCNEMNGSDLRHRLLKKRRINGLGSATNKDQHSKPYQNDAQYADKHRYRSHHSSRDQHHFTHESSISKRLQGRISLPGKPPSDSPSSLPSQRDRDRGKDWTRSSSPGQPLNYQGRLHGRIMRGTCETENLEGQPRKDEIEPLNFASPKSLAEIKGTKFSNDKNDGLIKVNNCTITEEQKNLILSKALGPHAYEGSLSFEGPKSLSEILQRKRAVPGNDTTSSSGLEKSQKVVKDLVGGSMVMPIIVGQDVCLSDEVPKLTSPEEEGPRMTEGEDLLHSNQSSGKKKSFEREDDRLANNAEDPDIGAYDQQDGGVEYDEPEDSDFNIDDNEEFSQLDEALQNEEVLEPEDGMVVNNMEDLDENYDQRDGELEYDEDEGTGYRTYDESDQKDADDVDDEEGDDDDDDFARKIGVLFS